MFVLKTPKTPTWVVDLSVLVVVSTLVAGFFCSSFGAISRFSSFSTFRSISSSFGAFCCLSSSFLELCSTCSFFVRWSESGGVDEWEWWEEPASGHDFKWMWSAWSYKFWKFGRFFGFLLRKNSKCCTSNWNLNFGGSIGCASSWLALRTNIQTLITNLNLRKNIPLRLSPSRPNPGQKPESLGVFPLQQNPSVCRLVGQDHWLARRNDHPIHKC